MNIRERTEDLLLSLGGCAPHMSGFRYLVDITEIVAKDPGSINKLTRYIYPTVAAKNNTTERCVERAIRYAIESIYLNSDVAYLESIFGNIASMDSGKPTNSAFIATLALKIRRELAHQRGA